MFATIREEIREVYSTVCASRAQVGRVTLLIVYAVFVAGLGVAMFAMWTAAGEP